MIFPKMWRINPKLQNHQSVHHQYRYNSTTQDIRTTQQQTRMY